MRAAEVDVLYADSDAMGIVYYAGYFRFFEAGRMGYMRAYAPDHPQWVAAGFGLPITRANCRYRSPARVFDRISVESSIGEVRRASFVCAYRIVNQAGGLLLAEGETEHVVIDAGGKVRRFDERMLGFFARAREG